MPGDRLPAPRFT